MSINLLLEMSRRSFRALDAAMNATGQNVANIETEGYSRRRVTMTPNGLSSPGVQTRPPIGTVLGAGVSVASYTRMKDGMLQRAGWEMNAKLGFSDEEQRVLGAVEGLFPVDNAGSLGTQLSNFWNAWRELADHPTDNGIRMALRSKAAGLAATLKQLDAGIHHLEDETRAELETGVSEANSLFDRIARLNQDITRASQSGSPDLDSQDERDRLLAQLSELAPIRVQEMDNGAVNVTLDGMMVVQDQEVMPLKLSGMPPVLQFGDTGVEYRTGQDGGRIGSWLSVLKPTPDEVTLPNTSAALDDLARQLVERVNAIHATGRDATDAPAGDFFDPAGVTAATIGLSAAVIGDPRRIAASLTPGTHDSRIALDIADLEDFGAFVGGETSEKFVINLVTGIGARIEQARSRQDSQTAAAMHLSAMEQGVSGVSLEEEMTNLIQFQHAYQASTRVLNTAQQMFDTLLSL